MHNVLIVEDERIIANDIQRTLQRLGYHVSGIVSSGEEALEKVASSHPDVVLMDIKLKGEMDGIETARRLHDEFKTPVVYLTAHAHDETLQRAKLTEPYGYIVKPFEECSLHATIEMAAYKHQIEVKREALLAHREKASARIAQSEEKLKKTTQELLRSNEELERFTSVASHDLKAPLCNIISYSQALTEEFSNLGEEEKNYIEVIRKSAVRMDRLINDLLEFAKIAHAPQALTEIDLKEMIPSVLEDLETKIKEKRAVVEVGDLPKLKGNALQIQHVFQNLIENALKYSRTDGQTPVIQITGNVMHGVAEIRVRDNGIGFEPEHAEAIFAPFKRLHANNSYEGTGIGLAICQRIIQNHGGAIFAKSRLNEGSEFIIQLSALN